MIKQFSCSTYPIGHFHSQKNNFVFILHVFKSSLFCFTIFRRMSLLQCGNQILEFIIYDRQWYVNGCLNYILLLRWFFFLKPIKKESTTTSFSAWNSKCWQAFNNSDVCFLDWVHLKALVLQKCLNMLPLVLAILF